MMTIGTPKERKKKRIRKSKGLMHDFGDMPVMYLSKGKWKTLESENDTTKKTA